MRLSDQKAEPGHQPGQAGVREAQHKAGPSLNGPRLWEEEQTLSPHMDTRQGRGRCCRNMAQWGGAGPRAASKDHPGGCLAGGWPLGATSPPRSTISSPSPCGMCGLWAEAPEREVTGLHLPRQALCCPEKCHLSIAVPAQDTLGGQDVETPCTLPTGAHAPGHSRAHAELGGEAACTDTQKRAVPPPSPPLSWVGLLSSAQRCPLWPRGLRPGCTLPWALCRAEGSQHPHTLWSSGTR